MISWIKKNILLRREIDSLRKEINLLKDMQFSELAARQQQLAEESILKENTQLYVDGKRIGRIPDWCAANMRSFQLAAMREGQTVFNLLKENNVSIRSCSIHIDGGMVNLTTSKTKNWCIQENGVSRRVESIPEDEVKLFVEMEEEEYSHRGKYVKKTIVIPDKKIINFVF